MTRGGAGAPESWGTEEEWSESADPAKLGTAKVSNICNFGSKRACCTGVKGGDRVPSTLQTAPFLLERDTTPPLKMAEKQLNRMIAQTLERHPKNSKVEKIVSAGGEKAERLEISQSARWPGRGGGGRRGGCQRLSSSPPPPCPAPACPLSSCIHPSFFLLHTHPPSPETETHLHRAGAALPHALLLLLLLPASVQTTSSSGLGTDYVPRGRGELPANVASLSPRLVQPSPTTPVGLSWPCPWCRGQLSDKTLHLTGINLEMGGGSSPDHLSHRNAQCGSCSPSLERH